MDRGIFLHDKLYKPPRDGELFDKYYNPQAFVQLQILQPPFSAYAVKEHPADKENTRAKVIYVKFWSHLGMPIEYLFVPDKNK